ncbi:MAG: hypothetical protein QOK15_1350 [Nocardioidaceae bacterium]|nr:hypothetical protein [Nocardioidaceae bacterium]
MSRAFFALVLVLLLSSSATGVSDRAAGRPAAAEQRQVDVTVPDLSPSTSRSTGAATGGSRSWDGSGSVASGSLPVGDPYVALAEELHARGVRIWFDTDLVGSWLAGPTAFRTTVTRLGELAKVPGFAGFKIADELGYEDGLESEAEAMRFLKDANAALDRVAPGAKVLVDAVVYELGCLDWSGDAAQEVCGNEARADYPAASVSAITHYLHAGLIDVLDLSTGLLEPADYQRWGMTRDDVQGAAWSHVRDLGWARFARLQARKALAEPGGYRESPEQTAADVRTYVTLPLLGGAAAVELWTWRQPYDNSVVSLLPDDLAVTPLWATLERLHAEGAHFFTNMTPSAMPLDPVARAHECAVVAKVFSAVLVAAGTG